MAPVWNILQWSLVRNTIENYSEWNALFVSDWTETANYKQNDSSKETRNSPSSMSSLKQTTKPVSNAKSIWHVGFINKGNTCDASSILQILSVMPTLWNRVPSESSTLSTMSRGISFNMAVKNTVTKPVDPCYILLALKRKLSKIISSKMWWSYCNFILDELKRGITSSKRINF